MKSLLKFSLCFSIGVGPAYPAIAASRISAAYQSSYVVKSLSTQMVGPLPAAYTTQETFIYNPTQRVNLGLQFWPDTSTSVQPTATPGVYRFYAANTSDTAITLGTLDAPATTVISTGITISNTPVNYSYLAICHTIKDTNSGISIGIAHGEIWPGGNPNYFWGTLDICYSVDGTNWIYGYQIVTPYVTYSIDNTAAVEIGTGPIALVGTNIYIYYTCTTNLTQAHRSMGVARCSQVAFFGSCTNHTNPTFNKYYNGGWTELGIGGNSDSLAPQITAAGEDWVIADIKYQPSMHRWVMVVNASLTAANNNMRAMFTADGITFTGYYVLASSLNSIYPSLFSPDAPPECLGTTNYIYSLYSIDAFGQRWTSGNFGRCLLMLP